MIWYELHAMIMILSIIGSHSELYLPDFQFHERKISNFFNLPPLPIECQSNLYFIFVKRTAVF